MKAQKKALSQHEEGRGTGVINLLTRARHERAVSQVQRVR